MSAVLKLTEKPAIAEQVAGGDRTLYDNYLSWERITDRFLLKDVGGAAAVEPAANRAETSTTPHVRG